MSAELSATLVGVCHVRIIVAVGNTMGKTQPDMQSDAKRLIDALAHWPPNPLHMICGVLCVFSLCYR